MNLEAARSLLIDHSRSSRNGIFPKITTYSAKLTNPLCGDHVELRLRSADGMILEGGFASEGCAICVASASLLCQEIRGKSLVVVRDLSARFEETLLTSSEKPWPAQLQGLQCFEHLRVNPSRKACALLSWVALRSALKSGLNECPKAGDTCSL